jgi:Fe-S-cluster containining protein
MSKDSSIRDYRDRPYFFDKGIRFQCQRCGMCCTGEPGIVYADQDEISLMAAFLEIPRQVLEERFLNPFRKGFTIREAEDGRCIFYENGCAVYPVRPLQCRTFPFWFQNMRSPKAWGEACLLCPGIGRGRLYTKEEILLSVHESYPIFLMVMEGAIRLR